MTDHFDPRQGCIYFWTVWFANVIPSSKISQSLKAEQTEQSKLLKVPAKKACEDNRVDQTCAHLHRKDIAFNMITPLLVPSTSFH